MAYLYEFMNYAQKSGFYDIALPFLLIFTLSFAILQKTQLLGDKKNINVVVSLVIGMLVIQNKGVVDIIHRFLPNISLFMVIILMFLFLIGIFAGKGTGWTGGMLGIAFVVSLIFVIIALSSDFAGDRWDIPDWWASIDDQTKATVLFIAVFLLIIFWVAGGEGGGQNKIGKWIGDRLKELGG